MMTSPPYPLNLQVPRMYHRNSIFIRNKRWVRSMSPKVKRNPSAHHAANLRSQISGKMLKLSLQEHWYARHKILPGGAWSLPTVINTSTSAPSDSATANPTDTPQPMRPHTFKPLLSPSCIATQLCVNPKSTWRCFWILRSSQWHFNKI